MRVQFIIKPKRSKLKAYILLFSCSVTRAVQIELVSNLTTTECIKGFMRLISRGKPKINYSDKAKNFQRRGEVASKDKQRSETPRFFE